MSAPPPTRPEDALIHLAEELRGEGPVIAPHVSEPSVEPVIGMLAAAGPRCETAPGAYSLVIELVREGYLCHYGEPRLLAKLDPDLRLLAGDHLYARGIERLAPLSDLLAVSELADLISIAAQLDAAPDSGPESVEVAWLAAAVAIGFGPDAAYRSAKTELRESGNAEPLWGVVRDLAERAGHSSSLSDAAKAVAFNAPNRG